MVKSKNKSQRAESLKAVMKEMLEKLNIKRNGVNRIIGMMASMLRTHEWALNKQLQPFHHPISLRYSSSSSLGV